jgi:hypothetical protein
VLIGVSKLSSSSHTEELRRWAFLLVYFSLGLCFAYSLFYAASYFGVSFFVLSNRGMAEHVISGSLVSALWDVGFWSGAIFVVLAWLLHKLSFLFARVMAFGLCILVCLVIFGLISPVSLCLVSTLIFVLYIMFSDSFLGVSRFGFFLRWILGAVIVVLFFEVAALALFNIPVALNMEFGAAGLHFGNVELVFSNLAYPFLSYAYFLFVLLGIGALIVKVLPSSWLNMLSWGKLLGSFLSRANRVLKLDWKSELDFVSGRFALVLAVFISGAVSCLFVAFTVLPWANPTNMLVSADSPSYYQWIVYMRSVNTNVALSFAFANDRALFLVLAYVLSFFISPLNVVQYAAALLIVLLAIISLFLLKLFSDLRSLQVLGILLVPFSFQALDVIYSGYFANMLALILVFVYIFLFFRFIGSKSSVAIFSLLSMSVLILFSHSWTWFIFALSLGVFLFLEGVRTIRNRSHWSTFKVEAIFVGLTIEVGLLSDLVRQMLSPVSATSSVLATVQSSLGFPNISYVMSGMKDTVSFILGGIFANQLLIALSIIGFLVLLKIKSSVSNFFVSWIFVACFSILFAAQNLVFDRFLFLLPWIVLSSLGLFTIVGYVCSHFAGTKSWRIAIAGLILVFVFLVLLNNDLRYLFNINIF